MTGERFKRLINEAFVLFLKDLGFVSQPIHVSGRYFRASFIGKEQTLIVSLKPAEDNKTVLLVTIGDDDLSAIDDRSKTPRLSDLNSRYMSDVVPYEQMSNDAFFSGIEALCAHERKLVKSAKELRLVLPKYLASNKYKGEATQEI